MSIGRERKFGLGVSCVLLSSFATWRLMQQTAPVVSESEEAHSVSVAPVAAQIVATSDDHEPAVIPFSTLPINQRRESWLKPFRPDLWHAKDWSFEEDSLLSNLSTHRAVFRQPYVRCSIGLRVASAMLDAQAVAANFELQAVDGTDRVRIELTPHVLEVREVDSSGELVVRRLDLSEVKPTTYLRITLTGDRLLVAVDEQLAANVAWPHALIGREVLFRVSSPAGPIALSEMRLDGESAAPTIND